MSAKEGAPRDWGLMVGYDELDESYTIRRHGREITTRYDAIGQTKPAEWFSLLIYDQPSSNPVDATRTDVKALQNAVAFANGVGYEPNSGSYKVDARGFAAFKLWRDAVASRTPIPEQRGPKSDGIVSDSRYTSEELKVLRGYTAAYCRELVDTFPDASSDIEKAAAHYD